MQRQVHGRTSNHEKIASRQLPDVLHKQRPLPDLHDPAGLAQIPQHARNHHDREANPEEDKEPAEVAVLGSRVEVGYTRFVLDGREHTSVGLAAQLASCGRRGLDRGRRIVWRSGRAAGGAGVEVEGWAFDVAAQRALGVCGRLTSARSVDAVGGGFRLGHAVAWLGWFHPVAGGYRT